MTRKLTVSLDRRPRNAPMGRFGGGWQWKLGVQANDLTRSRGDVIISLLTFAIRVRWERA